MCRLQAGLRASQALWRESEEKKKKRKKQIDFLFVPPLGEIR